MNPRSTCDIAHTMFSATIEWFLNLLPLISVEYTKLTISIPAKPTPTKKKHPQANTMFGESPRATIATEAIRMDTTSAIFRPLLSPSTGAMIPLTNIPEK